MSEFGRVRRGAPKDTVAPWLCGVSVAGGELEPEVELLLPAEEPELLPPEFQRRGEEEVLGESFQIESEPDAEPLYLRTVLLAGLELPRAEGAESLIRGAELPELLRRSVLARVAAEIDRDSLLPESFKSGAELSELLRDWRLARICSAVLRSEASPVESAIALSGVLRAPERNQRQVGFFSTGAV